MNHINVTLIDYTNKPFNTGIASARTCYSSKGIVYPQDVEKNIPLRDKIAKSTLKAGHLTTRQHSHFIFGISGISRQLTWYFLHSHPYYNSEQVSQRYVEVQKEHFYIPSLNEQQKAAYLKIIEGQQKFYYEWIEKLNPYIEKDFYNIFPNKAKHKEKYKSDIHKKCLEIARYFLPVATTTYLYHTINGLTLHRYYRVMNQNLELKKVVQKMVSQVQKIDPLFVDEIQKPLGEDDFLESVVEKEINFQKAKQFICEFDETENKKAFSKLKNSVGIDILSNSIKTVLGLSNCDIKNEEAIDLVLNPTKNKQLGSTLNEMSLSPLMRCLQNINLTYKKKLSHTADSQNQRHRTLLGSRPILWTQYMGKPDYIIPKIIAENEPLKKDYQKCMELLFEEINQFIKVCPIGEKISYLFPNAFPIRYYESGNLLNYFHKWRIRLCYNAQEEILQNSIQEVQSLQKEAPLLAQYIKAPCWYRYKTETKPYCPEGNKFCGIKVWKKENINEY